MDVGSDDGIDGGIGAGTRRDEEGAGNCLLDGDAERAMNKAEVSKPVLCAATGTGCEFRKFSLSRDFTLSKIEFLDFVRREVISSLLTRSL